MFGHTEMRHQIWGMAVDWQWTLSHDNTNQIFFLVCVLPCVVLHDSKKCYENLLVDGAGP